MLDESQVNQDAMQTVSEPAMVVHTIPMDFYGGKNPAPAETPMTQAAAPVQQKIVVASASKSNSTIAAPPRKTSLAIPVGIGAVLLLGGGFGVWWFALRPAPAPVQITIPPPPVVAALPEPEPAVELPPEPIPEPVKPLEEKKPVVESLIPPHTFKNSLDSDVDGLTDIEEDLWKTNVALIDSDSDSFPDMLELLNLYNPAGVTPQRILDSKLVSTYVNPEYNYSMYYPVSWLPQAIDDTKKEVLFTSITQEFISVRVLPFPTTAPFAQWFAKSFPGEQLSAYIPFVNKFKVSGVMSVDGMVAIITDGAHVYLLTYNGGVREDVNFRTTFKTMVQSFKTASVTTPIELLPKALPAPMVSEPIISPQDLSTSTADVLPNDVVFVSTTPATSASTSPAL